MSRPGIEISAAAQRDLGHHVLWLRNEADAETAQRVADAAWRTFARLAESPGIGSPVLMSQGALRDVRKWRIEGFPRLLIFYERMSDGIRIVRVLHASQDWAALLDLR